MQEQPPMTSPRPKVSVIMSVHNGEDYLRRSVESVLHQTFMDFEFIVVDDGSSDSTPRILEEYQDPRMVVLRNEKNIGLPSSLNRALEICRGEIVARQDADDFSLATRFSEQVAYLDAHPEIGVLGSHMRVVDEAGADKYTYELPLSHTMIVWNFFFGRSIAHPTVMYRRSVVEGAGAYDPTFKYTEDIELWTRVVGHTRLANLGQVLYVYQDRRDSISHVRQEEQLASIMMVRKRLADKMLRRDVPLPLICWLHESQNTGHTLTNEQVGKVIDLLLELRNEMQQAGAVVPAEMRELQEDMVGRIMVCVRGACPAQEAQIGDTSFSDRLPRLLQLVAKAAANPRRAGYVIRQQVKNLSSRLLASDKTLPESQGEGTGAHGLTAGQREGITVIVLSYERMDSLADLLRSLLQQDLRGIPLELMVCNNSERVRLATSRFKPVGRLLSRFPDVKIFNSSYNWRCRVRYGLGTLASHDTIMFIDDDIVLLDPNFIRYMYDAFRTLTPVDIISCWNSLWVEWTEDHFSSVALTFDIPDIAEITQTDTIGPGICMFNKGILANSRILNMSEGFSKADDMAFPLIAALEWGSRRYFLPSHNMLKMHDQGVINPLNKNHGHYDELYAQYRLLLDEGYQPVLAGIDPSSEADSPERRAARSLPLLTLPWK